MIKDKPLRPTKGSMIELIRKDLKELDEEFAKLPRTQIIHDERQILNPTQLRVGQVYNSMHVDETGETRILSRYRLVSIDPSWEGAVVEDIMYNYSKRISLADRGLIPYENGRWNEYNYLLPAEDVVNPPESREIQ